MSAQIVGIWAEWDDDSLYVKAVDADIFVVADVARMSTGRWRWQTAESLGYTETKPEAMLYAEKRLAFRTHKEWLEWCQSSGYEPT